VVAATWLHQGLWCKLLGRDRRQAEIARRMPGLHGDRAAAALAAIGLAEVALAGWVLSGRRPRAVAAGQTALLVAMNGAALRWSRRDLSDPAAMLLHNAALLALAWRAALAVR
jgi:DoxX-like family